MTIENRELHEVKYEEGENKQRHVSGQGLIGASAYWLEGTGNEVVGTNNANGTELISIDIPKGYTFACSELWYSSNEGRHISVCTVNDGESLGHASQSEELIFGDDNVGLHLLEREEQPIFVVTATSSQALDLKVYAQHTVFTATNDPTSSYFNAHIGGILYKSKVEVEGTS